jgi:sensor histidine kinase YesM
MKKLKLFDKYVLLARFFPCIISVLPLFVLAFFLSGDVELRKLGEFLCNLKFYGEVTLSLVALYFYAQLIRFVSKLLEASYFIKAKGFPTTYLMTYKDDTYSKDYKDKYRELVKQDFGIDLLDETGEANDFKEAKKRLDEVTKHVILKVKEGYLVLKHNIWYGFIRNLIGGAIFSTIFCILIIVIGITIVKSSRLVIISLVLLIPYVLLLIFWKPLLRQNAEAYAKQLIAEYISLSR